MGRNGKPCAYYPLTDVVKAIDVGKVDLVNLFTREKNKQTLGNLGLSFPDAIDHIRNLTSSQFVETSFQTGKAPADVYKKTISKVPVYIKFYLENDLVILSFHQDEARRRR